MRFVTFRSASGLRPGLLAGEAVVVDLGRAIQLAVAGGAIEATVPVPSTMLDVIDAGPSMLKACSVIRSEVEAGRFAEACTALTDVPLAAPIPRPRKNVFCVGSNYRAHVSEASRAQGKEDKTPEHPVFFTKPPTAVVGPGDAVEIDGGISEKMDYEVELGVVIGTAGRNIRQAEALRHIFGFTIINDITARDIQRRHGGQFLKGKGLDTSCPMGPQIVTIDELPDFNALRIALSVNGVTRQDGNTGSMIFSVPRLLESLSEGMTLEPGDLLATGTPSGVGYAMEPPVFLKDGDRIVCEIERIGTLENHVREEASSSALAS